MKIARKHLMCLYDLMRIPGPAAGSKSTSLSGIVGHSRDAQAALKLGYNLLEAVIYADVEGANECETRVRRWIERRTRQSWDSDTAGMTFEEESK